MWSSWSGPRVLPKLAYCSAAVAFLRLLHISLRAAFSSFCDCNERNERAHFTNFSGLPHFELEGKKVGLIGGNGTIGKRVCELAKAFRMKSYVYSRSAKAKTELYDVYQSLEELLSESDFVSVHCPLNDATRGMLDYEKLSLMKPTSYLINTARGAICNEDDLIRILREKKIGGACLDVQTKEHSIPNTNRHGVERNVRSSIFSTGI